MITEPAHGVRLRLLGAPALASAGQAWQALSAGQAALLVLLACQGTQPRARLAELLWPNKLPAEARNNLRQRLAKLKQLADAEVVAGDKQSLWLAPQVSHDLADPTAALRQDPAALQGALLGDLGYPELHGFNRVLAEERQRWHTRLHDALAQVASECEVQGRVAHALACTRRRLQADPLSEHATRMLMRLHERRGDPGAALAAFESLTRVLHDELGEAPGSETNELALSIGRRQPVATAPAGLPRTLRHPPRTVGREAWLTLARTRLAEGVHVLVAGPAGVGKSRLFDDLVAQLPIRLACRLGADDGSTSLSLWRLLARELQGWLPLDAGEAQGGPISADARALLQWLADGRGGTDPGSLTLGPDRLRLLLHELLQAAHRAGLQRVAADNLHFADADSLALLARVLAHNPGAEAGPAWLLTSRDPLPAELEQWHRQSAADRVLLVELPALNESQVHDLLDSLGLPGLDAQAWAPALHQHCGGHPLSILQVLADLSDSGALNTPAPPPQLPVPREAVTRLLRALDQGDPTVQQLAFVAALAGTDFSPPLAERLLRRSASELMVPWRRLEALGVFRDGGFSHDLMRQAVLDAVPRGLAPSVHGEIAQVLHEQARSPERRALHWEAAGEWPRAAADAALAAEEPLAAGLVGTARGHLLHAAALHERAGDAALAFHCRWRAATEARGSTGDSEQLAEAQSLMAQAQTPEQRALAACVLADAMLLEQDAAALGVLQQAAQQAQAAGHGALALMARRREAEALRLLGRTDEALALIEALRLDPLAATLSDHERTGLDLAHAQMLGTCGRRTQALVLFDHLLASAVRRNDPYQASDMANQATIHAGALCRIADSVAYAQRSIDLALHAGMDRSQLLVDEQNLAAVCFDCGQFARALTLLERVVAEMRRLDHVYLLNCEGVLASVFFTLGRPDLAHPLMGDAPASAPTWARAFRHASQARLRHPRGPLRLQALREALHMLGEGGVVLGEEPRVRLELEQARNSEPGAALPAVRRARLWAQANEHVGMLRMALMAEAEALLDAGQAEAASEPAEALQAELARGLLTFAVYPPEMWRTLCRVHDRCGRSAQAQQLAHGAAQWIRRCAEHDVPPLFRESFLQRNVFNSELLRREAGEVTMR